MRTEADILPLRLQLEVNIEIDLERLEEDPTWRSLTAGFELPAEFASALRSYLDYYLVQEGLLRHMPCTCGPGTVQQTTINSIQHSEDAHGIRSHAGDGSRGGSSDPGIPAKGQR